MLGEATRRLPKIDGLIEKGQYAYAYQLASSSVDEADRALATAASAAVYAPPRRAAWPLVALCLGAALLAPALAAARRDARPLVGAALGLLLAVGCWAALVALLRGAVVARLPVVAALLTAPAIAGVGVGLWLGRERSGGRGRRAPRLWRQGKWTQAQGRSWPAVESLVLLAALPAAVCAYRYGYPWGLRLEETASLFRWRSALLAPTMALLAAAAWRFLPPALSRLHAWSSRPRPPEVGVRSVNLREHP